MSTDAAPPLVTMLLLAYNQQDTVAAALRAAMAQTYSPLEIVVSDDASGDGTFAVMQAVCAEYRGPHRLILNCNARNLGIGAHLSKMVSLSQGELLVVTAGDDRSVPTRCEHLVTAWLASDRRLDLLASAVLDLDEAGATHEVLRPTDLSTYRSAADWLARPPYVIGAAQAWTRRVFDHFGPLPEGVVAEDLIMVFRAIVSGGACTLSEPLVHYRRGGISRRRRALSAANVVERLLKNNRHALVEGEQLLADARVAGQWDVVAPTLTARLQRERFIQTLFAAPNLARQLAAVRDASDVAWSTRLRMLVYAAWPGLLAPLFALKRWRARRG